MKLRRIILSLSLACMLSVAATGSAAAHVVVRPAEVVSAGFQTFTVGVPSEKESPTTTVKLLIPEGLRHVSPTVKPGWQTDVERQGEGEAAVIKSITWSNGSIPAGFRDDFGFSAQVPAKPVELRWKAYQTYQDGQTVAWDLTESQQPKKTDGSPDFSSAGPFSTTKVVAETETASGLYRAEQAAAAAKASANRALYIALAGLVLGMVSLALATRKKA